MRKGAASKQTQTNNKRPKHTLKGGREAELVSETAAGGGSLEMVGVLKMRQDLNLE